jgi:hypothetical protein
MNDLFLFPAANPEARQHLEESIEHPLAPARIAGTPAGALVGTTIAADDIRCWGATPGSSNRRNWERMQAGDVCLIYGGGGEFRWWGRVLDKVRDAAAAMEIWGTNARGETWEYMYFLELSEFPVPVSLARVASDAGYDPAWRPRGFTYYSENAVRRITEAHGSTAAWIYALGTGTSPGTGATVTAPAPVIPLTRPFRHSPSRPVRRSTNYSGPDPDTVGRGVNAHRALVDALGDAVRAKGFLPEEPNGPSPNYDLSWDATSATWIIEAKSLTLANQTHQLRLGLGQLLEFLYVSSTLPPAGRSYRGALVVEDEPTEAAKWIAVCATVGVELGWPGSLTTLGL